MPNQPAAGVHGHYVSAVPDQLWSDAAMVAAALGESVSSVMRRALAEYVERNRRLLDRGDA